MLAQNGSESNPPTVDHTIKVPSDARQWYAILCAGQDPGTPNSDQFNGNLHVAQLLYDRYQQASNFKDFESALHTLEQNFPYFRELRKAGSWRAFSPAEFVKARPAASYCDGDKIVQANEITAIVSQPGVGKSFWMLAKAADIADRGIPVLIIAAEGMNPDRILALEVYRKKEGKESLSDRLQIVDRMLDLTDDSAVDAFVEFAAQFKPKVLFIDTLAACNPGQDENSVQDMQPVMNRIRDQIIVPLECAVVLLHHTTKDGQAFRGSNAIRASVTNMYYLIEKHEQIILRSNKQRDAERSPDRHYQLIPFETRKHPVTGEQLSSAVLLPTTKVNDDPRHELTPNQRKILEALDGFAQGLPYNELRDATELQKSSLYDALRKLKKANFIQQSAETRRYAITEQGKGALNNA